MTENSSILMQAIDALRPFAEWGRRFDPSENPHLEENAIDDDFRLQDTLAPDELTVGHLRKALAVINAEMLGGDIAGGIRSNGASEQAKEFPDA